MYLFHIYINIEDCKWIRSNRKIIRSGVYYTSSSSSWALFFDFNYFPFLLDWCFFFLLRFMHRFFGRKNNNKVSGEYIASKWRRWRVYIVQALTARMKIKTKRNNMINKMERNFVSIDKAPSIEDICLECFRCHLRLYIFFFFCLFTSSFKSVTASSVWEQHLLADYSIKINNTIEEQFNCVYTSLK